MRPYLIAIAGPSGSGKTEVARSLSALLAAPIVSLDSYYRDASQLPLKERARINFDEPQSMDHELLAQQMASLAAGEEIEIPVYDFTHYVRNAAVHRLRPGRFTIIEGIFALYWEDVRKLAGTKVFIDVSDEICLARRMDRDIRERGRSPESVIEQYAATVQPMARRYVRPTSRYADVLASGCDRIEQSARRVLEHIEAHLPEQRHGAGDGVSSLATRGE